MSTNAALTDYGTALVREDFGILDIDGNSRVSIEAWLLDHYELRVIGNRTQD